MDNKNATEEALIMLKDREIAMTGKNEVSELSMSQLEKVSGGIGWQNDDDVL